MSKTRKLSYHIPFDIQSEIIQRLPVKSLLQFRSISKQWKSFIDDPKFIKNYHVNHANPQHHLLVSYESDTVHSNTEMVVIWNPTVRKSVSIVIPRPKARHIVCFGVCPDTSDPKLVKITYDKISWVVEVFTLSRRVWKTVYTGAPFKLSDLTWIQAFVNGVIYFRDIDYDFVNQVMSNFIISYDLKSEKFGEVCLPERLVHTGNLKVTKVNESLGLLEYDDEGGMKVCGVWSRKDGADNQLTKIYTIKVERNCWLDNWVLGFLNNGDVVMELDSDNYKESRIAVYENLSRHINDVGINGKLGTFYHSSRRLIARLLDQVVGMQQGRSF